VADAAANTVDEVSQSGVVEVLAFIPNPPHSDAVPTCIDRGGPARWDVAAENVDRHAAAVRVPASDGREGRA
jgi:hypothetical protein